jgi:hypothetical protein
MLPSPPPSPSPGAAQAQPGFKASAEPRKRKGPTVIDLAAVSDNESSKSVELAGDRKDLSEASGDEELRDRLDGPAAGRRTQAVQRQQKGQQLQRRR